MKQKNKEETIKEAKSWLFEQIDKMNKLLAKLAKKEKKEKKELKSIQLEVKRETLQQQSPGKFRDL